MPECDTIFRTARTLGRALCDKALTGFYSTYPLLTRYNDDTPLTGQTVAVATVLASQLRPVSRRDVTHVRELATP